MHRNTYLTINIDNLLYNINYLKSISNKDIIPVIKANAYGTCDYYVAKLMQENGIKIVAVSSLDEALKLRSHNINIDILILGYVNKNDLPLLKKYDLSMITISEEYIFSLKEELNGIKFHIKIDSGMHRLGIKPTNAKDIFDYLKKYNAKIDGLMTHYACSDESDETFTSKQYQEFKKAYEAIGSDLKYIHTSNTDASIHFSDDVSSHIRVGLGLWGYSTFKNDLKPTLSLYSEVIATRKLEKGEGLGYGLKYISDGDNYISILPIGYADGLLRKNSGGKVYIGNEIATIVGNICMDQCFIKSKNRYDVHTKVEIFGKHIKLQDISKRLDSIPYEIITNLSDRINRIFIDNDNNIKYIVSPRFEINEYRTKNKKR